MSDVLRPETVEFIRKEFHHLDTTYFNTAYFGPSPYSAKQKVSRALQKELDPSFHSYANWIGIPERLRLELARLLNCSEDQIFHSTSSSDVFNIVANGYPFKKGDVVCSIDKDYPSNVLPWMRAQETHGVEFKLLELGSQPLPTAEWLAANLPANCKVFDCSWVSFDTGKRIDVLEIGKLCRERDILFLLDATQAFGGMPISEEELSYVDVFSCSSYKWMLGPYGHAFGYMSKRAIEKIQHTTGNWIVSPNSKVVYNLLDYTTETLPGARKFDRGQAPNMLTMSCLEAGVEFLLEVGLENVAAHNASLRDRFLENYPKKKFQLMTPLEHKGNILALKAIAADPIELERELKYRNIDVSVRQGNVRLSFHIFNTPAQVDKLIEGLDL